MTVAPQMMSSGRTGTGRDDWQTPPELLARIRRVAPIGLDPCAGGCDIGEKNFQIRDGDDGLEMPWRVKCGRVVYVNPPYSKIKAWSKKVAAEREEANERPIIMLVAARPDTKWWAELVDVSICGGACCFLRGRLRFVGAAHPAPFPSAVWCLAGPAVTGAFVEAFMDLGWIVPGRGL